MSLWNDNVGVKSYEDGGEKYQGAILEQYKLYVEMADRVSNRRGLANTFFLTLNTGIFAAIGVFWKDRPSGPAWLLLLPLVLVLAECMVWRGIINSYQEIRSAKQKVIAELEERLPAAAYGRGEYGRGESAAFREEWRSYRPMINLEQWMPILFGLVYLMGFVVAMTAEYGKWAVK
jgi:hypothetical protein